MAAPMSGPPQVARSRKGPAAARGQLPNTGTSWRQKRWLTAVLIPDVICPLGNHFVYPFTR